MEVSDWLRPSRAEIRHKKHFYKETEASQISMNLVKVNKNMDLSAHEFP